MTANGVATGPAHRRKGGGVEFASPRPKNSRGGFGDRIGEWDCRGGVRRVRRLSPKRRVMKQCSAIAVFCVLLLDASPPSSAESTLAGPSLNNVSESGGDGGAIDDANVTVEASPVASPGNELPIVGPPLVTSSSSGSCQVYQGVTCGQYLGNRSVFVRPPPATLAAMEEKLAAAFTVIATSQDVSATCHKYAIPSLCFFVFPPCEPAPGSPADRPPEPRSVCRDECELLEQSLCRMEYSIAKRHPLIGQQNILPVCEDLPPIGSPESDACLRLGVPHREVDDANKGTSPPS
ncbi:hypothetical protein HPB48_000512 [Haemaphysalis longicornis]|uniref:FZ domain-containing protein n=1 Tax=Haemaphysalis longicornis TaxID=44386 RepID=A0A9J6FI85_HAELO|nr:hypothetical protein HPB48_000512 [Haemaphysalis longicornis]